MPPTNGPTAIPQPNAASYIIIAFSVLPTKLLTIVASAVETNKAFPTPQPARYPINVPISLDNPPKPANTTIMTKPAINVFFKPIRLDKKPVNNITTPVTNM